MSVSVKFIGLRDLQETLRKLPLDVRTEADRRVRAAAQRTYNAVLAQYPDGETGKLRKGVVIQQLSTIGQYHVAHIVKSVAPHVHFYEDGTKQRWTKKSRPRAYRGFAPAHDVFVPTAIRIRNALLDDLIVVIERAGLEVRR